MDTSLFSQQDIIEFIKIHGYWLFYLLTIIEGPIVTVIAGSLAALGIMNWKIVFLISVFGDLTMDFILYEIGFIGNNKINRFIKRHPRLRKQHQLVDRFFKKHGNKIIFFVKISTGLCYMTFITAGMMKMSLKKFLTFSFLGGIIWSGLLVFIGYFYGNLYGKFDNYLKSAGLIIFLLTILTIISLTFLKNWQTKKILNK